MLRNRLLLTMFLAAAAPALAEPATGVASRPIDLTGLREPVQSAVVDEPTNPTPEADRWHGPIQLPGISWGQPPTEFGPVARKRAHLATVRLEGVTIFGGSVGASVDGRSAHISLSWPTDH